MLSNKLTFSLASLIMISALALASTSVMAAKPILTITAEINDARDSMTINVKSSSTHTYDEWLALAPAYRLLDQLGREIGDDGTGTGDGTAFTPPAPADPFGANAGFIAGSTLRMGAVNFTTSLADAGQTAVTTVLTPRSVRVMLAGNAVRDGVDLNDATMMTFDLPPILNPGTASGEDGTLEITGGDSLTSPYEIVLTFTGTDAPAPLPSPVFDFEYDPYPERIGARSAVETEGTGEEATHTYTFMIQPAAGSTTLTVSVDPTYAQDADGMAIAQLKVTDVAPDVSVPGEKAFHVYQSSTANGIELDAAKSFTKSVDSNLTAVDLEDLLRLGGTIELAINVGPKGSTTHTVASDGATAADITAAEAAKAAYRLVITEVMWGLDGTSTMAQWVEVYNNGAALKTGDSIMLTYHPSERRDNVGKAVTYGTSTTTYVVVDQLSTINRFGSIWAPKGQSGHMSEGEGTTRVVAKDLISMYRKITLDGGAYKAKADAKIGDLVTGLDGLGDGGEAGSWEASGARTNLGGRYIGSPGAVHVTHGGVGGITVGFGKNPGSLAATGVIINEVRNDTSEANLDWIELYHFNDATDAVAQNLENWTVSIVTRAPKTGKTEDDDPTGTNFDYTDTNLFSLPKYKLPPNTYLVIYNRDPGETSLAGGVNIVDVAAGSHVNKGASHMYFVADDLDLPSDMMFTIILRDNHEKAGTHEKIVDFAGNGFFPRVEANKFNTDFWPLIGWAKPAAEGIGDNSFTGGLGSWGRVTDLNDKGVYRPKSRENDRFHGDDWKDFGFVGTGYDRDVDPDTAPGTPGYANVAVNVISDDRDNAKAEDNYAFGGSITISEVMYDARLPRDLVQWIELYNNSSDMTVNLDGWRLEIRNIADGKVESYVDTGFNFDAHTKVLPNQTLLLVSRTGPSSVPSTRVYDLNQRHRQELGLQRRDKVLLSSEGFYLELQAKVNEGGATEMVTVDTAGNLMVDGATRTKQWDLPPSDDEEARNSIVRQYEAGAAADGSMEDSWKVSDFGGLAYYGHREDVGTPGYRRGGPLPVSLSSFRPVRDKATGHVAIRWITQSELNNAGFNILRREGKDGEFKIINVKGIIPGHGTTSEKHVYTYTDTTAKPNVVYYYQIEDVSLNGNRTTLAITHMRGNVSAGGKLTTRWSALKSSDR